MLSVLLLSCLFCSRFSHLLEFGLTRRILKWISEPEKCPAACNSLYFFLIHVTNAPMCTEGPVSKSNLDGVRHSRRHWFVNVLLRILQSHQKTHPDTTLRTHSLLFCSA